MGYYYLEIHSGANGGAGIVGVYQSVTLDYGQYINIVGGDVYAYLLSTLNQSESSYFVNLYFHPHSGYQVDTILRNGREIDSSEYASLLNFGFLSCHFLVNTRIDVTFTSIYRTIASVAGSGGTISPASLQVLKTSSQRFTITPNSGYAIDYVLVDGVSVGNVSSYTFPADENNHTIAAYFASAYRTIISSAGSGGVISPSGSTQVLKTSSQVFTITPNFEYSVDYVLVDGVNIGSVLSYTFPADNNNHTISVFFSNFIRHIISSAGLNGRISFPGDTIYYVGESQNYSIIPSPGFQVADVLVDGVSVGAVSSYLFTNIQTNHTIVASFEVLDAFFITTSVTGSGSISPSGSVSVVIGTNKTFTLTPLSGFYLSDVLIDGVSIGSVNPQVVFTNVQQDHTLQAVFSLVVYTINALAGLHGVISPSGEVEVEYQTSKSFTIIPDTDYRIQDIKVDGVWMDVPSSGILIID